jgi:sodium/potassium-transporting ATPase subunit alpha
MTYVICRFRTLFLHADDGEEKRTSRRSADPNSIIGQIDIHLVPANQVFTRFGTSMTIGLEGSVIEARARDGKNIISKPPNLYREKMLNYVFGGFNFLMWIAFIAMIVRCSDEMSFRRTAPTCI